MALYSFPREQFKMKHLNSYSESCFQCLLGFPLSSLYLSFSLSVSVSVSVFVARSLSLHKILHHAAVLGPGLRAAAQLRHAGVLGAQHPVGPGGRALHQPKGHLRQPGPATALPRPHRVCRRVQHLGRRRQRLCFFLVS